MLKLSLVVVLALCIVAFAALDLQDPEWTAFTVKHSKRYTSDLEHVRRFKIFKDNMKKIAALRGAEKGSAEYGPSAFADMTSEEFHAARLMPPMAAGDARNSCLAHGVRMPSLLRSDPLPDHVDWRDRNAVTPVKNQGSCGSCWTFSTTGNIESQWFLAGHELISLSEQQIVDCDHTCSEVGDKTPPEYECDQGCNGGWPWGAMKGIMEMGGIEAETTYKYRGVDGKCNFKEDKVVATIQNYTCLPTDENEIAAYLAKHGPLSVSLNAATLQFYFGGIMDPSSCNPNTLTHAVLLVGYGTDKGKDYWLVKNSWGTGWGEKGYFRIVRGKGACGINNAVCSALVK